jgi:hypothetical protein
MSRLKITLGALVLAALTPPAAMAQGPAGPPGPPPENGLRLPAPPGTAQPFVPPGPPVTVPAQPTGPGLLNAAGATFNRKTRSIALPFACQANGTISFTAPAAGRGTLDKARYRCSGNRSRAQLTVSRKVASKIVRRKHVAARATVKQGSRTAKLDFDLHLSTSAPKAAGFWTDGHLLCTPDGATPQGYLAEPDFTTQSPTRISTRGWVAWYTAAGGWHWLGLDGESKGRWETWTATVGGVEQFHPSGPGTPSPFTWGPITVPPGIQTVGVYEIVYWVGGLPQYTWHYVNAGSTGAVAAGGATQYCAY